MSTVKKKNGPGSAGSDRAGELYSPDSYSSFGKCVHFTSETYW